MSEAQGNTNEVFTIVERKPKFPGERRANAFIANSLRCPEQAMDDGVEGTVFVSFMVEKDGSISNPKVLGCVGQGCDVEVHRVVKGIPNWKPGKLGDKAVRVQYNLPIRYKLTSK